MITPAELPLNIVRGLSFGPILFEFKDENDLAINLTGYSIFAEIRHKKGGNIIFDFDPYISDAPNGKALMPALTPEQTLLLPNCFSGWDLILQDANGLRTGPYLTGPVTISNTYTQPE